MELSDHHIFVPLKNLKDEFKFNYSYIKDILKIFNLKISRLVCSLSDPKDKKKYHSDEEI
jgi:threonyl-tRNA synthetase